MIDEKKYEGHTPAPWRTGGSVVQAIQVWTVDGLDETENWIQVPRADRLLAVDAPLLLAEVKRLREENDFLRSISSRDAIEAHGKPVNWVLRKLMFDDCIETGINRRTAYYAAMGYMLKEAGKWTPPKEGPYADIFNGDEQE